jgi:glycopeptide antibiotics resistance protein
MKLLKYLFIAFYAALLLYAVFFARRRRNMTHRYLNIYPLRNTIREFHALNYNDKRDLLNFFSNLAGNFILFIPYTFIMVILFNYKNSRLVLLSVFLLSLSIEVLQYVFRVGVADIDDLLLNTAGGWAGILVCTAVQKRLTRKNPAPPGK